MKPQSVVAEPGVVDWPAVVADAVAAPSAHNTQPWRFVARRDALELYLDPTRILAVADPGGRQARMGCGAALFNLRLALRARGHGGSTQLLPDRTRPLLLAVVRPGDRKPVTPFEQGLYRAVHRRHSHRRPFYRAQVPAALRRRLVEAALREGAELRLVYDQQLAGRIAVLVQQAERVQQDNKKFADELSRWTFDGRLRHDGVPRTVGGPRPAVSGLLGLRDAGLLREPDSEPDPLLAVLLSHGDTPLDQVRAGQALQRVLLTATVYGAAANLMAPPVEVPRARAALRKMCGGASYPQLVLRFGMAGTAATTPRRPVGDVLQITSNEDVNEKVTVR